MNAVTLTDQEREQLTRSGLRDALENRIPRFYRRPEHQEAYDVGYIRGATHCSGTATSGCATSAARAGILERAARQAARQEGKQ